MSLTPHRYADDSSHNVILALMIGASLLAHVLLFSAGGLSWVRSFSMPEGQTLSVRLSSKPTLKPPKTQRLGIQNADGGGNTQHAGHLAHHQARPLAVDGAAKAGTETSPAPAPTVAPTLTTSQPTRHSRSVTPPSSSKPGSLTAGSLLAQVGELAQRRGDEALSDNHLESGKGKQDVGLATRGYEWTRYQEDWRLKVERIGNLNYPDEARRQDVHGAVTLVVTVNANGSLRSMRVSRSSGSDILDNAARRIVELCAPFAPFPPSLASRFPSQQIVQRFVFTRDNQLSSR